MGDIWQINFWEQCRTSKWRLHKLSYIGIYYVHRERCWRWFVVFGDFFIFTFASSSRQQVAFLPLSNLPKVFCYFFWSHARRAAGGTRYRWITQTLKAIQPARSGWWKDEAGFPRCMAAGCSSAFRRTRKSQQQRRRRRRHKRKDNKNVSSILGYYGKEKVKK